MGFHSLAVWADAAVRLSGEDFLREWSQERLGPAQGVQTSEQWITGDVFAFGQNEILFKVVRRVREYADGHWTVESEFYDVRDLRLVMKDRGRYHGIRPLRYQRVNLQKPREPYSESYSLEGEKLVMTYRTSNGKERVTDEKHRNAVVFGPVFGMLLKKEWLAFLKGESITVWIASAYRQSSYRFRLRFLGRMRLDRAKSLTLFQMSGVSLLVRAFTDPIDFFFETDSRRMVRVVGPTPLRRVSARGNFDEFRGDSRYRYLSTAQRTFASVKRMLVPQPQKDE